MRYVSHAEKAQVLISHRRLPWRGARGRHDSGGRAGLGVHTGQNTWVEDAVARGAHCCSYGARQVGTTARRTRRNSPRGMRRLAGLGSGAISFCNRLGHERGDRLALVNLAERGRRTRRPVGCRRGRVRSRTIDLKPARTRKDVPHRDVYTIRCFYVTTDRCDPRSSRRTAPA